MATAGILDPRDGAQTSFTPLISTSTESEEIPAAKVQARVPDVAALLRDFKPDDKRLVLAAHVTGPAETAFPDGPPKDAKPDAADAAKPDAAVKPDDAAAAAQIKTAKQPINVVVIADTDVLEDRFWVQSQDFF